MNFTNRLIFMAAMGCVLTSVSVSNAQIATQSQSGFEYNWRTGRWEVVDETEDLYQSALDPNRNRIDPGSLRNVDEQYTDASGVQWRRYGQQWTSYGVPHGNIKVERVSGLTPGVDWRRKSGSTYFTDGNNRAFDGSGSIQPGSSRPSGFGSVLPRATLKPGLYQPGSIRRSPDQIRSPAPFRSRIHIPFR
ncbi:MAG: hypothetical protein R3C59_28330 [Planctomycetaceae bacterium]